jgi:hypothetical protein
MKDKSTGEGGAIVVAGVAMASGFLSGAGVFIYQSYMWLRFSEWQPFSAITLLKWLNVPWAIRPEDWLGLHKLLDGLPLSLTLFVLGVGVGAIAISFTESS